MLRKYLVALRIAVLVSIAYFFFAYPYFHKNDDFDTFFLLLFWVSPLGFILIFGLTAWIDAINNRLHPVADKERNTKAVIGLIIVVALAAISLFFLR